MKQKDHTKNKRIKTERQFHFLLFNCVFPILLGGLYYYLYCPDVGFVRLLDACGWIKYHRTINWDDAFFRLLRYYLSDFLWAYSFSSFLCFIRKNIRLPEAVGLIGFEILLEFLQLLPFVSGTFDPLDIAVELIANLIAAVNYKLYTAITRGKG